MTTSIFSFVPEARVNAVLSNLQEFTGLAIQLIDSKGSMIMSFGQSICCWKPARRTPDISAVHMPQKRLWNKNSFD
ncbi:MAG TPA: hypothetical protein IAB83_08395 [Candidatus Faecousia faecavium]|nr:hypothetical protein [Candidatus Faecousia faecavium]